MRVGSIPLRRIWLVFRQIRGLQKATEEQENLVPPLFVPLPIFYKKTARA